MSVAILVPRRADGGRRDELWEFCRKFWESNYDYPIIEGDHSDGLFNRSAAINTAANLTDAEVLVVVDSDVYLENPDALNVAIEIAAETGQAVLPHKIRHPLNEELTERVLSGEAVSFDDKKGVDKGEGVSRSRPGIDGHVSSVIVVPRALFEKVGGFDDRFVGWGGEDRAFHHACRVAAGGVRRVDGRVIHLYHPYSAESKLRNASPDYRACDALKARYYEAEDSSDLEVLLEERFTKDATIVVYVTHGRPGLLERAIESARENLSGPIVRSIIVDNSRDKDHHAWCRYRFPEIQHVATENKSGVDVVHGEAFHQILRSGVPWAFLIQDDFTFNEPIRLEELQDVMRFRPHLAQMALKRQAWFDSEKEAGGVVERKPNSYKDCTDGTYEWLEHRNFFTLNPSLIPRATVVAHSPWPTGRSGEARFGKAVFTDPEARSAFWGSRLSPPVVHHDGERNGVGY